MAKILHAQCRGPGSISGQGTRSPMPQLKTVYVAQEDPWAKTETFVVVQSLSRVQLFVTPWTAAHQAPLPFTISQSLLKLMSTELVMPSYHLIPFSSCLQSFSASGSFQMSQFFTSGGQSIGASASASVLPMNIQS